MDSIKLNRKLNVTFQYGWDGKKNTVSISRWIVASICCIAILAVVFSIIYLFSISPNREMQASIAKLSKENKLLRDKLQIYSTTLDSIMQKVDSLQTSNDKNRVYPYYNSDEATDEDNTFAYDALLDAEINDFEKNLVKVIAKLDKQTNAAKLEEQILTNSALTLYHAPSIYPAFGKFSDGWGLRIHPIFHRIAFHYGVDISNRAGTPVYATADGVVKSTSYESDYGKVISIIHNNGYETRYGHLASFQIMEGDTVKKGQIIGLMGSTGYSTGPHLHYEVLVNNVKVNPARFLNNIESSYYARR